MSILPQHLMESVVEGCLGALPPTERVLGIKLDAPTYFVATLITVLLDNGKSADEYLNANKAEILVMIKRMQERQT